MRIIHLASGDLWAGAEVQLYHLACHLLQQHNVTLLVVLLNSGQLEQSLRQQGVDVKVLSESELSGLSIFLRFLRIAKSFKTEVIHTHRRKENVIGGLVSWIIGCKSVRTVHGASELTKSKFDIRRFVFALLDRFVGTLLQGKIVSVSDELANKLSKNYPASKIVVIENGIDAEYVYQRSKEKIELVIPEGQFNVVFAGRFVPVKRVDIFLDIAHAVTEKYPEQNIHFYLLGDGPLWQEANQRINGDGLQDRVHLLGFVKNTAPYFKRMDLLLITSDHEGLPMTLLEALVLELPVMSHGLPTIEKVLCDGMCGIIVNANKYNEYVEKIEFFSNKPKHYFEIQKRALGKVLDDYSMQINVSKYMSVYQILD